MAFPISLPFWIALGAIPGALCRYYLTLLCAQWWGSSFPVGTFLINLSGACLMGFCATVLQSISGADGVNGLVAIGFLGSYTTFSTYALDTSNLLRQGNPKRAMVYGLGSPIAGFLGVEVGIALAQGI
jgi:CrcB protein